VKACDGNIHDRREDNGSQKNQQNDRPRNAPVSLRAPALTPKPLPPP
jgi:hypothetical protein